MTAVELNAQIWRDMGILADNESMMKRVAKFLRKLVAEKQTDPTEFSKEEFFSKLDRVEREIAEGKGTRFTNLEDMHTWLNSL